MRYKIGSVPRAESVVLYARDYTMYQARDVVDYCT